MSSLAARPRCRPRCGFTLVELLTVIAIIGLLISLLLPALAQSRETARMAMDLANMKGLGFGYHTYSSDYNALVGMEGANNTAFWPYAHNTQGLLNSGSSWIWGNTNLANPGFPGGYWNNGGPSPATNTGFAIGIGGVNEYVAPKLFYSPGNPQSFSETTVFTDGFETGFGAIYGDQGFFGSYERGFGTDPDGIDPNLGGARSTYFYRGSKFYRHNLALTDTAAAWNANWTSDTVPTPQSPALTGKVILTNWFLNMSENGNYPPSSTFINGGLVPWGGNKTNLLMSDGSAKTWRLPGGILPLFEYIDDSSHRVPSQIYTGGGPGQNTLPGWWVYADYQEGM